MDKLFQDLMGLKDGLKKGKRPREMSLKILCELLYNNLILLKLNVMNTL